MNISLFSIPEAQKNLLAQMIYEYQQELLGVEDPGEYKYLDSYWQKETRKPFFIKSDNDIAGLVLINQHSLLTNSAKNIAEFYVKPSYRKKGVGKEAAKETFYRFPGLWEVRVLNDNNAAIQFWRKVIDEVTQGKFEEVVFNKPEWHGPIFNFRITDRSVQ